MRTPLMGGASRFAHFAGLGGSRRRGARADADEDRRDDERDGRRGSRADEGDDREGDDETRGRRGSRADDGDDRDGADDKDGRRSSRADEDDREGDDDETRGRRGSRADDDENGDERGGKRSRRAETDDRDAEDEDDDEKEARGNSAAARAWRKSQARCAAIFAHPQAAADPELASILAFETDMPRSAALARLNRSAGSQRGGRGDDRSARYAGGRSDRNPQDLDGAPPAAGSGRAATAAGWDRSMSKASGGVPAASGWDRSIGQAARR